MSQKDFEKGLIHNIKNGDSEEVYESINILKEYLNDELPYTIDAVNKEICFALIEQIEKLNVMAYSRLNALWVLFEDIFAEKDEKICPPINADDVVNCNKFKSSADCINCWEKNATLKCKFDDEIYKIQEHLIKN